jgi:hypothetical protein
MATANKDTKIPLRTKLALRLILVMIKMIEPWQYSHEYTKDFEQIDKLLKESD